MRRSQKVQAISKRRCQGGGAPYWDAKNSALCYVDLNAGAISRLDPDTREDIDSIRIDQPVSFAIPISGQANKVLVGYNHNISIADMKKKKVDEIVALIETDSDKTRVNDAHCDSHGRLWVGSMGIETKPLEVPEEMGSVYSIQRKQIRKHVEAVTMPHAPAWTSDYKTMFYVDSLFKGGRILVCDFEAADGDLSNQKTAVDFGSDKFKLLGRPFGIAMDQTDKLWIACYNGSNVIRIDPSTGTIIDKIQIPTQLVTSVCFGGEKNEDIFVTTGFLGLNKDEIQSQPDAGAVFRISGVPGVKGQPCHPFIQ